MMINLRINFGDCKVTNNKRLHINMNLKSSAKYVVETNLYKYYFDDYKEFVNKFIALTYLGIDCTCKILFN